MRAKMAELQDAGDSVEWGNTIWALVTAVVGAFWAWFSKQGFDTWMKWMDKRESIRQTQIAQKLEEDREEWEKARADLRTMVELLRADNKELRDKIEQKDKRYEEVFKIFSEAVFQLKNIQERIDKSK